MSAAPSLYLFDGYNLLHATAFEDRRRLIDTLASFLATRGARGVVVFDGVGTDGERGPLAVRYAADADSLLERLAAEHREQERVVLVTSDSAVFGTAGRQVARISSQQFVRDLRSAERHEETPGALADKLDAATRERLERLRRGE